MNLSSSCIRFRLVEVDDAEFILSLRLDPKYNKFISHVQSDIALQQDWIRKYKSEEEAGAQYYFIIERIDGTPCGTVRIYDFRTDSFSWGSWILNAGKPRLAAVESAFLVYKFGFEVLGFQRSHFEVVKGNKAVSKFHQKMGAVKTWEDAENLYFEITKESVQKAKEIILKRVK